MSTAEGNELASSDAASSSAGAVEVTDHSSDDEGCPLLVDECVFKWRLPPDESFSDWKIEIVSKISVDDRVPSTIEGNTITHTYYCHKAYLALGARKSEYFARLFRNGDYKESQNCTSRIELDPLAADCFPYILDYMYAPERQLQITTETATVLHHLGEYFEMPSLRWEATQFCKKDLSFGNADIYYEHATVFQDDTILSVIAKFLGSNIQNVPLSSPLITHADVHFWITSTKKVHARNTMHWSKLVAEIGNAQVDRLSRDSFQTLTDASGMPKVHADVALKLCEVEDTLDSLSEIGCSTTDLSSLQARCATALSQTWKDLLTPRAETVKILQSRKASFLVDLLVKSLGEANKELQRAKKVIGRFKPRPTKAPSYAGHVWVPQEVIDFNPALDGAKCQRHIEKYYDRTNEMWSDKNCPVFFYDSVAPLAC
jgi:BTB/POZ domain